MCCTIITYLCLYRYEFCVVPLCLWQYPRGETVQLLSERLSLTDKELVTRSFSHLLGYYLPHLTASEDLLRRVHGRDRAEKYDLLGLFILLLPAFHTVVSFNQG